MQEPKALILPELKINKRKVVVAFRDLLIISLATAYAFILSSLPLFFFADRENYLIYAGYSELILQRYAGQGFLTLIANEPLWLLLNIALARVLPLEAVLRAIIAVPAFLVAWMILRRATSAGSLAFLLFLLFYPSVVKNHILHLRQGVAIALFLIAILLAYKQKLLRWFLIGMTPFIHSSFFLVILVLILSCLTKRMRFAPDLSLLTFVAGSALLTNFVLWFARIIGARQGVELLDVIVPVSGFGFVFWLGILSIMIVEGKEFVRLHRFAIAMIIFYLHAYFIAPFLVRVFESALLLIFLEGLNLTRWRLFIFRSAIIAYGVIFWLRGFISEPSAVRMLVHETIRQFGF